MSLAPDIRSCRACQLEATAKRAVVGEGPIPCKWVFVGEAPGAEEDRTGRPFVGMSGRGLDRLLGLAGLERGEVYVTNVVKHRPPANRTPLAKERAACLPWLMAEMGMVQPEVVVALGKTAVETFVRKLSLTREHGKARLLGNGIVFVPWFHPAAALRNASLIPLMEEDARRLKDEVMALESGKRKDRHNYRLGTQGGIQEYIGDARTVGFDTETTSPKRGGVFQTNEARLVGYSFSTHERDGVYVGVPLGQQGGQGGDVSRTGRIARQVGAILGDPRTTKVCHNAKFEWKVLANEGIELRGFEDTKIAAYLLGLQSTHLKDLARQVLGEEPRTYEETVGGRDMSEVPPEEVYEYAAADADNTLRLWGVLKPRLESEGLWGVYEKVERPLIPVLARMERTGICLDIKGCQAVLEEIEAGVGGLDKQFRSAYPGTSLTSPPQLALLLSSLGAPIRKRTAVKRLLSTDDATLQSIRGWNPGLVDTVLEHRKLSKLRGYVGGFLSLVGPDGRLHTSFNQAGTWEESSDRSKSAPTTGRLSSNGPNLQNIPHHGDEEWGGKIRRLFVSTKGRVLVSCDIEQEEPRIAAIISNDAALLAIFRSGGNPYEPIGTVIYGRPIRKDRDPHEYFVAKTYFLAMLYGAGAEKLKEIDPSIPQDRAEGAWAQLRSDFPGLAGYVGKVREQVRTHGFVQTLYGRKRWIHKWRSPYRWVREEGIREAANMPIQGTAADIIKLAMVEVDGGMDRQRAQILLQVHDELVFEADPDYIPTLTSLCTSAFSGKLGGLGLPLEFKVGENWGEMRHV